MSKTINRTIMNTSANVTFVNTDEQTFGNMPFTFTGNLDEKAILKEANKRLAPNELAFKVTDIQYDTLMFTMTAEDFMRYGLKGLKPTTRTRYVTTHIKSTISTVLVVNGNDEVERIQVDTTGMSKAKVKRSVEEDGYIYVKVVDTDTTEDPYYMTEEDFIAFANVKEV